MVSSYCPYCRATAGCTCPPSVLFGARPTSTAPAERHWFVPDESGFYCLACSLPPRNARHAARAT